MGQKAEVAKDDERYDWTQMYISCQKWFRDIANVQARKAGKSSTSSYIRDIVIEKWREQEEQGYSSPLEKYSKNI